VPDPEDEPDELADPPPDADDEEELLLLPQAATLSAVAPTINSINSRLTFRNVLLLSRRTEDSGTAPCSPDALASHYLPTDRLIIEHLRDPGIPSKPIANVALTSKRSFA
jgi:hypothetical protein